MRPDRRFGVGRAWLALAVLASLARGQDWKPEPVDPNGHSGDVVAVATSGQTLATAGSDGLAKVWDLPGDGKLARRVDLIGHDGKVLAVALSPDGAVVATGGYDRTVRLWDAVRGTPLATLKGHSGPVEALAFSPDGQLVASAGLDTSIRLWDVGSRQVARTLQGHEQGVRGLAFSPDGKLLASAARDHLVKLWDVAQGGERATLGHHDAPAWCLAFAPDGKTVASGGLDKLVRVWRVAGPAPQLQPTPQPHPQPGADARRRQLDELTERLREMEQRMVEVGRPQRVPTGLPEIVPFQPIQEVQPTPFPRSIQLGGGMGGGVEVVQQDNPPPAQPNQVQAWQAGADVVGVAFSPDGKLVAAAVTDLAASRTTPGSLMFFQGPDPEPKPTQFQMTRPGPTIRGHLGPIWGLAFLRDGQGIASVGGDASVRLWDPASARPLAASIGRSRAGATEPRVMAHLDPVEALAITPDGKRVATASESAGVSLWDATNRTLVGRLRDANGPVRALAISPDGKILATGGDGKIVSLWEMDTGRPIDTLKGHLGAISALAFSPDGKTLASGSKDASVTLWDVAKKAEVATLARHTSAVTRLAFRPDGSMLATAGLDYTVKLWDLPDGRFLGTLDAHKDVVDALAFTPDGQGLASGDRSGMVRVWDVATKAERLATRASSEPIRVLAISPDGQTMVGGGDDGSIRRWDLLDGNVVALRRGAHAGAVLALAFDPLGKALATGGLDRELKLWDVDTRLAPGPFADLEGKVQQIALSPDGKTLATSSDDQFVRVWDVATGRERFASIPIPAERVRLAFSPDSKRLATLPVDNPSHAPALRDVVSGRSMAQAGVAVVSSTAQALSPDGKSWAITQATTAHLWSVGSRPHEYASLEATQSIRSVAFSPDSQGLAAGLANGSVTIWDAADRDQAPKTFRPSNRSIDVLAYSPDGRSIALGGADRVVRIIDANDGTIRLTLRGHRGPITGLRYRPDGKLLASAADGEAALFVWDASSGEVVSNPTLADASHGEGLACLAFSPDGKSLFAGGDRGVTTFDMTEGHRPPSHVGRGGSKMGRERATLRGHASAVRSLVFAENGAKLVSRSEDGAVKVWDLLDGNRVLHTFGGADFQAQSMALRPEGKTLAVGLRLPPNRIRADGAEPPPDAPPPDVPAPSPAQKQRMADEVKIWDLDSGEAKGMISGKATKGGADRVVALAYSRDGRRLATTSVQGIVRIWDADTLEARAVPEPREKRADLVQFTPDGQTLMGADASGLVTLWDVETGKVRASFTHEGGINQALIAPDGRFVATAGGHVAANSKTGAMPSPPANVLGPRSGGDVRLWDPSTGRRVAVLPMVAGPVTRIAFSGDGKTLAASSLGAVATAWDVDSAEPVATLAWPSGEAKYLTFSPDGKALAIGGDDEMLRVWDVPAGTLRADLPGHADAITWLAFSPDGKTIATAGRDTTIKLWDVP